MNKRITTWRPDNRQRANSPYHIHQAGSERAWEANQFQPVQIPDAVVSV